MAGWLGQRVVNEDKSSRQTVTSGVPYGSVLVVFNECLDYLDERIKFTLHKFVNGTILGGSVGLLEGK